MEQENNEQKEVPSVPQTILEINFPKDYLDMLLRYNKGLVNAITNAKLNGLSVVIHQSSFAMEGESMGALAGFVKFAGALGVEVVFYGNNEEVAYPYKKGEPMFEVEGDGTTKKITTT